MEYVAPGDPNWAELARRRAHQQAADAAMELPSWPIYALHAPDRLGRLGGISRRNGQLVSLDLIVGEPGPARGPVVSNQLLCRGTIASLDRVLADWFAADGRDYPVPGMLPASTFQTLPDAPRALPATVMLDDLPTAAMAQQVAEYTAVRVVQQDVVITAAGPDLDPQSIVLNRVTDLAPYQGHVRDVPPTIPRDLNWQLESQWHRAPDRSQPFWAHRGLLEMTMRNFEQHRVAMALNRPHQQLDPDWGLWWAAAAAQQEELTGQDKGAAKRIVGDMVNQVTMLAGQANWWSNPKLRQRAVNQILWFTTTGDQTLSSAAAQRSWAERDRHPDSSRDAWAAWADEEH